MNAFDRDYSLSVAEEIRAWERHRRIHDMDCLAAFVTGVGFGAVVVMLIMHWTA